MDPIIQYLNKQGKTEGLISCDPRPDLGLIVVIPAYKEPNIEATIRSLFDCEEPNCSVEIIVLVNSRADEIDKVRAISKKCFASCMELKLKLDKPQLKLHVLEEYEMSKKKGGVGLARRILMDEATLRLNTTKNGSGIISNLDADCLVSTNYLVEIEKWFEANPKLEAASIHFEHNLDSTPIIQYELHLRYFIGMQRLIDLPFAFQTVGSAMAVRMKEYAAVGGMNTRKAGEDFYFMHKFIKNDRCGNLHVATVFPSGRQSDRVPFGTGRAVGEIISKGNYKTYNPGSFYMIKELVDGLEMIYDGTATEFSEALSDYFVSIKFYQNIAVIKENTTDFKTFRKRFYQYFDAFRLMKCLHYLRDHGLSDVLLEEALPVYFREISLEPYTTNESALLSLREYDKN